MFWISFLIFNFSYLFRVLFLAFLVFLIILLNFSSIIYIKFLIILVYIRGVVIFMLYISCMCWYKRDVFRKVFLFFGFSFLYLYDFGSYIKLSDVGEFLWIFLFFGFLFNRLVVGYSIRLFKISGSLRF